MMRALYTAATGMRAEQTNVDTIANNLSNVNTTGFKGQRTEFKSLLYHPCGCNHIHLYSGSAQFYGEAY